MTSSWINNFAGINHTTYIPTESTNIDDLFQNKDNDKNISRMIELKEVLLNLIQDKDVINFTDEEKEEIKEGEKDDKKNMDTMIETIKKYTQEFIQLQDEINEINEYFQTELKLLEKNISTIENMINFLLKLPNEHKDEIIMKSIIDSMGQLSQKILKNDKIKSLKEEYIQKRKELEKYLYFIKALSNFNQCNTCPLCFTNTVDHFIDPCGHTICKDCIQSLKKNLV